MNTLHLPIVRTVLLLPVLLFGKIGTVSPSSENDYIYNGLEYSYRSLSYTHLGLGYPPNQNILSECKKKQDLECLKPYNRVQEAKQFLLYHIKHNKELVYDFTFKTIRNKCGKKPFESEQQCTGAIVTFYFFSNSDDDKRIVDDVRKLPKKIQQEIFSLQYEWFFNRPHPDLWINFVKSLSKEALADNRKKTITDLFESSKKSYENFGVML